jgi:hypothetical protein
MECGKPPQGESTAQDESGVLSTWPQQIFPKKINVKAISVFTIVPHDVDALVSLLPSGRIAQILSGLSLQFRLSLLY